MANFPDAALSLQKELNALFQIWRGKPRSNYSFWNHVPVGATLEDATADAVVNAIMQYTSVADDCVCRKVTVWKIFPDLLSTDDLEGGATFSHDSDFSLAISSGGLTTVISMRLSYRLSKT
jgi:hypothetical protein